MNSNTKILLAIAGAFGIYELYNYYQMSKAADNALAFTNAEIESIVGDQKQMNLQAFLRVLRQGESSQDPSAYAMKVGGGYFTDPNNPDWSKFPTNTYNKQMNSDAAGAYQIISPTWNTEIQPNLHLPDFSPDSQDKAAVFLISLRGAYDDVVNGNFTSAINKLGVEWASLSSSPYGQPVQTLAMEQKTFTDFGGEIVS